MHSNVSRTRWVRFIAKAVKHCFGSYKNKEYQNMLCMDSNKEKFSEIYKKNFWGSSESGSGAGSEKIYTEKVRRWLIRKCPIYGVKRFLDVACGDFNWMRFVVSELDIEYIGLDIVDNIIEQNITQYSDKKTRFEVADICKEPLPDCDFLMIRDCLFHLSFTDINNFLLNLSNTNYKFLLTTTHILLDTHVNTDITSGDFRTIDLFNTPFNFQERHIVDRCEDYIKGHAPREMILVAKADVPTALTEKILNAES